MTIIQSNPIYDEDERGLPIRTPYTRYKVKCDICGRQVEFLSDEGVSSATLEPYGMSTWLRPEGMGHICGDHSSDLNPPALVEMDIEAPASEIPELTQANLIECLRYSAFKMCGKGQQEDYASDAMSMAIKEIERLRNKDILYYELPGGIRFPAGKAVRDA